MEQRKSKLDIRIMTKAALCISLLSISSYLVIPLPFTPIVLSLHTVMVNLIGLILSPTQAGLTVGVYLIMGLIGLPVFSAGSSGPGKLFGPTGGFYFGFLIAVIVISLLKGARPGLIRYSLVTVFLGIPIQHIMAILFMVLFNRVSIPAAAMSVSIPFLVGDVIKCIMASVLGVALNQILFRFAVSD